MKIRKSLMVVQRVTFRPIDLVKYSAIIVATTWSRGFSLSHEYNSSLLDLQKMRSGKS